MNTPCPSCRKVVAVPDTLIGKVVACPSCKGRWTVAATIPVATAAVATHPAPALVASAALQADASPKPAAKGLSQEAKGGIIIGVSLLVIFLVWRSSSSSDDITVAQWKRLSNLDAAGYVVDFIRSEGINDPKGFVGESLIVILQSRAKQSDADKVTAKKVMLDALKKAGRR